MAQRKCDKAARSRRLDGELDAYSAAAQATLTLSEEQERSDGERASMLSGASGATLMGAVGAALLGGGDATAAWTTNGDIKWYKSASLVVNAGNATTLLNFDGGGWDIKFSREPVSLHFVSAISSKAFVRRLGYAVNFAKDATIQTTAGNGWATSTAGAVYTSGTARPFNGGGYLGVRLQDGGLNYGWVEITNVDTASITIQSYAYNTAGGNIKAGQTGPPVPEPSTIALALLASGAAGVMASRRKKLLKGKNDA